MLLTAVCVIALAAVLLGCIYALTTGMSPAHEPEPLRAPMLTQDIYAKPGQIIILENNDVRQHLIMAGGFDSRLPVFGPQPTGPGSTLTFAAPSHTTLWICDIHPWLTGTVHIGP